MLVSISSADDDRVRDYMQLRDVKLRKSLEAKEGLFIAEGEKIIRRALESGYEPRSFLLAPRWLAGLKNLIAKYPSVPVYLVTEDLAEKISGFHVHRGALASMRREDRWQITELLDFNRLVVCEGTVDHTNLGAIIRNSAGLGWDGILLSETAADPLYRRAIKTSMGAVFSLPWARMNSLEILKNKGFTLVATALGEDSLSLDAFAQEGSRIEKLALLVGTEGAGLSDNWREASDVIVQIPMYRGIDSLNVAAASAICCYMLRYQK